MMYLVTIRRHDLAQSNDVSGQLDFLRVNGLRRSDDQQYTAFTWNFEEHERWLAALEAATRTFGE